MDNYETAGDHFHRKRLNPKRIQRGHRVLFAAEYTTASFLEVFLMEKHLNHLFASPSTRRVLVLGDLILDRYLSGNANRISPEAPVPVVRIDATEIRLGGAASSALMLHSLGADVCLCGVFGDDENGRQLQSLILEHGIDHELTLQPGRQTTTKERVVGRASNRHPHQMVRVDYESTTPVGGLVESKIKSSISSCIQRCDAVLVSDYAKGVCTNAVLRHLMHETDAKKIPVIVDPALTHDYSKYRGATLLTPNRVEAGLAAQREVASIADAIEAGKAILQRDSFPSILITLDRDGILFLKPGSPGTLYRTQQRDVYDITGAGDMVLAVIGLAAASRMKIEDVVPIANLAAGLVVERMGAAAVTAREVIDAFQQRQQEASARSPDQFA